jgi:hypothetical protein
MNAKIETPEMMIYAMASEIEDFNTVLHGVSSPLPILAMSVAADSGHERGPQYPRSGYGLYFRCRRRGP